MGRFTLPASWPCAVESEPASWLPDDVLLALAKTLTKYNESVSAMRPNNDGLSFLLSGSKDPMRINDFHSSKLSNNNGLGFVLAGSKAPKRSGDIASIKSPSINGLNFVLPERKAPSRISPSLQYQEICRGLYQESGVALPREQPVALPREQPDTPPIPWRLIQNQSGNETRSRSPPAPSRQPAAVDPHALAKLPKPVKKKGLSDRGPIFKTLSEKDQEDLGEMEDEGLEDLAALLPDGDCQTLMIKHIPCRCTRKEVLDAIAEVGFDKLYNFFHLPVRRVNQRNFGYAFIGFPTPEITAKFAVAMTGYRWSGRCSTKECEVAPARIQGFNENVNHFRKAQKAQCMRRRSHLVNSKGK